MARYGMIMAGGSGTRLWPMSRKSLPKQLIPFIEGKTLLEVAAKRLEGVLPMSQQLICTAESSRDAIANVLPEFAASQIIGEPEGRDTVNAVGLTAAILAKRDPNAIFVVITADHLIEPQDEFRKSVELGFKIVEDDPKRFVTFAITATYPSVSYGYVERGDAMAEFAGAFHAKQFHEKPDLAKAEEYLAAKTFAWNSGMFVFGAEAFLTAFKKFMPENHAGVMRIAEGWDTSNQKRVLDAVYPTLAKKSVDHAVMEPAARDGSVPICVVPMRVNWLDVGSWPSFGETLQADASANRANARVCHIDSKGNLAISDDASHTIATIGCHDLIIVHTADATLVCPRKDAERIRHLVSELPPELR